MSSLDELYREVILEHYKSPHNHGRLDVPDVATKGKNPLCGDEIEISLRFDGDSVDEIRFSGRGCSISQASASMLTDAVKGKSIHDAEALVSQFKAMMRGEPVSTEDWGDLESLSGVRRYPARVKCALLAWTTLEEGLQIRQHNSAGS